VDYKPKRQRSWSKALVGPGLARSPSDPAGGVCEEKSNAGRAGRRSRRPARGLGLL